MNTKTLSSQKLGTFTGVFLPNFLQMMGVIFFLKLGQILGDVGLGQMLLILSLCALSMIITSCSVSAIATNMKVRGSGAYFIISSLFGAELGGAMGLLLLTAQLGTIALCVCGLCASVQTLLPNLPSLPIQLSVISSITLITFIAKDKMGMIQMVIFSLLAVALSVFLSSLLLLPHAPLVAKSSGTLSFWVAFSLFFPAATGIETGLGLAKNLKNPGRSLFLGTIASVLSAFSLYFIVTLLLANKVGPADLRANPMIGYTLSTIPALFLLGIWGSFFSSALNNFLAAPITLNHLAEDRILPKWVKTKAVFIVLTISIILSFKVQIDRLIPFLTMIFLTTYGLINFIAGLESFLHSPSWRPKFAAPPALSIGGALLCLLFMLMINAPVAICQMLIVTMLWFYCAKKNLAQSSSDLRYSLLCLCTQRMIQALENLGPTPKGWHPHLLAFLPKSRSRLIPFSKALDGGRGFVTLAQVTEGDPLKEKRLLDEVIEREKICAHAQVTQSSSLLEATSQMIQNYGYGPFAPNTFLLPINQFAISQLAHLLQKAPVWKKNLLFTKLDKKIGGKQIQLWWRGGNQKNFDLSLALALSLRSSPLWEDAQIKICSILETQERKKRLEQLFEKTIEKKRISGVDFEGIVDPKTDFFPRLIEHSKTADLTFLGLRLPFEGESNRAFLQYLDEMITRSKPLDNVVYLFAGEPLSFDQIFV